MWRLGYLFAVKIDDALLLNDSLYFSIQAGRNSEGDWFREGLTNLPGAEHGPLTSLYLTPWSLGGGDNVGRQRFAITLLGIAVVPLVGLLARRVAGPRAGLVAAAIAAVYPNLWINDSLVMSESLAVLLVTVALLVALVLHDRPTWPRRGRARRARSASPRSPAASWPCSRRPSPGWRGGGRAPSAVRPGPGACCRPGRCWRPRC